LIIFICGDLIVRGVLRQVTLNKVTNYYGLKIKIIVKTHPKIKRGKIYAMVAVTYKPQKYYITLKFYKSEIKVIKHKSKPIN